MKVKWSKNEFKAIIIQELVVFILLFIYTRYVNLSYDYNDLLFITGGLFICLSLYRMTRILGLYDSTIYGFKNIGKVFNFKSEKTLEKDLNDYINNNKYTKTYIEPLITGIFIIIVSFI